MTPISTLLAAWTHPDGWGNHLTLLCHRTSVKGQLRDDEGHDERLLAPRFVAARRPHVPGAHLSLEKDRTPAAIHRPKLRHPLGRLPVGDARVVETAHDEQRRILRRLHVVVGRVALA